MSRAPGYEVDWNLVRTFVSVVDAGSLAGAARTLKLAHPTVARHIQQLESQLGVSLFERCAGGLVLNEVMSVGRCVITTDGVGAARDLVEPGSTGELYHAGDVDRLAKILAGLVWDPAKRRRAHRVAVVSAVKREESRTMRLATKLMELDRHLAGAFHRRGAVVRVKHPVQPAQPGELLSQLDRRHVR